MAGYTIEDLKNNKDFLKDAQSFLRERNNKRLYDPQEITDEFMEHMRSGLVNEVTLLRDLDYARKADEKGKARMARLMTAYEEADPEFSLKSAGDVVEGLATAPSTYLGLATGFMGKAGAQVGLAGTRTALKSALGAVTKAGALPGAVRGSAAGAASSAFATDIEQRTREEVGLGRQEGAVASSAIMGGVFGGGLGALAGKFGGSAAEGASELEETAQTAISARNLARREAAKKTKERLRALDKDIVEQGEQLLNDLNANEALAASLEPETIEAVASAAMELGHRIGRGPEERITEAIARGLNDGRISSDAFKEIIDKHGLSIGQFTAAYTADISIAARKLGTQSKVRKQLQALADKDLLDMTPEELAALEKGPSHVLDFLKSVDRLRLASMTSQMVTTARNVIGGGYRLFVDALDEGFDSMLGRITGKKGSDVFKNSTNTAKYMFKTKEAAVVQSMLTEQMPTQARKLFFSAADAEAQTGSNSVLGKIGSGINILNTKTDEIFKRAAFTSSLDRQLRKAGQKSVVEHIRDGEFGMIDESMVKTAVNDALYFTYQKRPSGDTIAGKLANNIIDAHREAPFVVSAFIPFPRFIANQMQFAWEHAPALPIMFKALGGKAPTQQDLARQLSATTLLGTAVAYRATQDASTKWNEHIDSEGKVMDLSPVLGPMAPIMLMADFYVRMDRGDPIPSLARYMQETMQSLGTPRFTGTFGIPSLDRVWDDLNDAKFARAAGRFAGDVAGSFLIPAIMLRDVSSIYDEDQTYIRNMETVLPSTGDGMIDFMNYTMHHATKNLPVSFSEEERRSSITAGVLRRVNPAERQLSGFTRYERKTALQKELDRLQIDRRSLFPRDPDPIRNAMNEGFIGNILPARMAEYMRSDDYQVLSDLEKSQQIKLMARNVIQEEGVKEYVDEAMMDMVGEDKRYMYRQFFREAYEEMPTENRRLLEQLWKQQPESNGESIQEAGAFHWAIENAPNIRGLRR